MIAVRERVQAFERSPKLRERVGDGDVEEDGEEGCPDQGRDRGRDLEVERRLPERESSPGV